MKWIDRLCFLAIVAAVGFQVIPREVLQRQRVFISDFGGIPNDGKDDSAAILAARRAALALGTYHLVVDGYYDIFPVKGVSGENLLHPYSNGDGTYEEGPSLLGIKISGIAQNYSGFILHREEGEEHWLYDAETPGKTGIGSWNRAQFDNISFRSDLPNLEVNGAYDAAHCAEVNGFRIWSEAPTIPNTSTRGFIFTNARFHGLGRPLAWTGGTNTDSTNCYSCWFHNNGPMLWDNQNALAHGFYSCHLWASDDICEIGATAASGSPRGGGGWVNFHNCDIIQSNVLGDTTPHYTIRVHDNAMFRWFWNFHGCKWELRGPESRFLKWVQTTGHVASAHVSVFDSSLGAMQQNVSGVGGEGADPDGRRYICDLGPVTRVAFTRVTFAEQLAFQFSEHIPGAVVGQAHQGTVLLDQCALPVRFMSGTNDAGDATDATRGLAGRIALSNGYGRVIGTNNYSFNGTTIERAALDFDYGGKNAARAEPGVRRKRVYLKTSLQEWPRWLAGVATSERTLLLPEGAKIVRAGLDAPATGSGSTLIQYRIGSDDKSISYCASGPAQSPFRHVADNEVAVEVGSDLNLRRVRLWMGPVENGFQRSGGEAWVEYE